MAARRQWAWTVWAITVVASVQGFTRGADIAVPHAQDKPPGPALSPAEAIAKMKVPEGFQVEVVAAEPDIVNPVAMTFDERGRAWITESLEYPRREPGPGQDRVKILEDTDGDGKADKFTIFADGLNIPSGIAVGHGGVWVGNAPDILFYPDANRDGQPDGPPQVIVTGFGRTDTHELPNSFTWGPDGWLYGLNGVFNHSHVFYPKSSPHYRENQPGWKFTCALFRIHPVTKEFQLFCEGTSNPWGVAFDNEGSAFISACVIDHLWHLVETGYYHRQGGPYPPFTWKIESIVKHKHQKAAYCGIHYFDSDAYPEAYRRKLYMGNIHGGCVNVDKLQRQGSTYFATGEPDFLTANDAWFMPVVQKTGPDGCLWVLDWYDRYHCYQDANRDPKGIDRLKGRLYRVRYQETPRAKFDLATESDEQLVGRLNANNDLIRGLARRVLQERLLNVPRKVPYRELELPRLFADKPTPRQQRLEALWTMISAGQLPEAQLLAVLADDDATVRAWGVRAAGDWGIAHGETRAAGEKTKLSAAVRDKIVALANDPSRDVQLQVVIAAGKIAEVDAIKLMLQTLETAGDDPLLPRIVWQNLHPLLETRAADFVAAAGKKELAASPAFAQLLSRAIDRILAVRPGDPAAVATLFAIVTQGDNPNLDAGRQCLQMLSDRIISREVAGEQLQSLRGKLEEPINKILATDKHPLHDEAAVVAASWRHPQALAEMRTWLSDLKRSEISRLLAVEALVTAQDPDVLTTITAQIKNRQAHSLQYRGQLVTALARLEGDRIADTLLGNWSDWDAEVQPRVVEVLTQRVAWGKRLLAAVAEKKIAATSINVNQAQRLLSLGDAELTAAVAKHWGTVRTTRDPKREEFIGEMRKLIRGGKGDAVAGQAAFQKVCGQCHKMHGQGQEVGPDLTSNGRASFEQLLSNVFDPSLVIGASYQARTVLTDDGRALTGLLVEDSPQRVVLKMQGGKLETIPRGDVQQMKVSELSMMPEGVEKQLQPQEIVDLFAFLTLDKHPTDPGAKLIPGTVLPKPREESDPMKFGALIDAVLPGFHVDASGEGGVALVVDFQGRSPVLRTHPVSREKGCVIYRQVDLPKEKKSRLLVSVLHEPRGDWDLIVKANGKELFKGAISSKTVAGGWREVLVDLSAFAGQSVKLELINQPSGWSYEHAFWSRAEILME